MPATQHPKMYRPLVCGDTDSDGNEIICGSTYLQESMELSVTGSVPVAGQAVLMTLIGAKQPVRKSKGSAGGFTRIEFNDGSSMDIKHRSYRAMVTTTIAFHCPDLSPEEYRLLDKFLTDAGNHTVIRVDDQQIPANVIYGKIEGNWQGEEYIRLNTINFSVKQEPGVTSL